ncbi:3-oxoacyl-[acyl-carrier-protein] synthase-3 [Desulfonauticus submarinus]|uniref:Beta-ketoacyl-[acyl-carrier-protein] synthase III n=1 Tax=Desulfonauticus submarinus TaxID=206665 RepID=A0A1H0FF73_9BACT|nr:beta-ketoacyl-ACP synthase III [Desulfonauticus submarinus]SDN93428.1 3-oxoacyl-[acyl-carrier-protein] synthase-3 [Desulfonauticus submarinus]
MEKCNILGIGHFVPNKILTNEDLEKIVDTSDEWITTRTGIKQRHLVEKETCSDLAFKASLNALKDANLTPEDLTHILIATFTPDAYVPNASTVLQAKLGLKNIPCFDVNAACTGFLYALELARGICAIHEKAKVLVVASEILSSRMNFQDRTTCVLFGDAAGAIIVSRESSSNIKIKDVRLKADGTLGNLLTVIGGGSMHPPQLGKIIDEKYFVQMKGREVFKHAVRSMASICEEILESNNLSSKDINLFIPHQANIRIIEALAKKLDLSLDKVYINVQNYGNTSAASIPLALSEAYEKNKIRKGDKVLLVAFGGGFTWGASILEF